MSPSALRRWLCGWEDPHTPRDGTTGQADLWPQSLCFYPIRETQLSLTKVSPWVIAKILFAWGILYGITEEDLKFWSYSCCTHSLLWDILHVVDISAQHSSAQCLVLGGNDAS